MVWFQMSRTAAAWLVALAWCSVSLADAPAESEAISERLRAALQLIPANADVAIVIPNLKILSDQITESLEGMDRANLLVGTRPMDQLKAIMGFNIGINDIGSIVIAIVRRDDGQPVTTWIVPVSDTESFFAGNFTKRKGDALTMPNGTVMYAKPLESHVVLSTDSAAGRTYQLTKDEQSALSSLKGGDAADVMSRGELFVIVRPAGVTLAIHAINDFMNSHDIPGFDASASCIDGGIVSLDCDALGLIVRSLVQVKTVPPLAPPGMNTTVLDAMNRLRNKSFHAAGSIDVNRFGRELSCRFIGSLLGLPNDSPILADVQSVQFAVYPSSVGVAGGLLNDAVLIVQTSKPVELQAAIRQRAVHAQQDNSNPTWSVKWEEGLNQGDVIGTTDAYEINFPDRPEVGGQAALPMGKQVLFGRVGWRGFVKSTSDAVIITFSRRPAVLEAAIQAASKGSVAQQNAGGLHTSPAIRTMRRMFPNGTAAEMYLSVSSIAAFAREAAATVGQAGAVPEVEANLPPIGIGASPRNGAIESAVIIPSGVLAAALDEAMRRQTAKPEPVAE